MYGKARIPGPGRSYKGEGMNKTERLYAAHLEALKRAGTILGWAYDPVKLRLAAATFYTPDFLVIGADGAMELQQHPWFRFLAVRARGGVWEIERFGAWKHEKTEEAPYVR